MGLLNGRVIVIVHTETDEVIRIISARKATINEEINYFKETANLLAPEVAEAFPASDTVNDALRLLITIAKTKVVISKERRLV